MIEKAFIEEPLRSFETTPFIEQVWFPMDSVPYYGDEDQDIPVDYLNSLVDGAIDICMEYKIKLVLPTEDDVIDGMEVGDDRCDVSTNPFMLAMAIYCQSRVIRFTTSEKDTGISRHLWNFCEVTSVAPSTSLGSIQKAKKSGFDNIEFIDSPPLRIIIDCQKGDRSHSSSSSGKASMLGARVRDSRTDCKPILHTASWMQDSMLGMTKAPDPKYLPKIMGGCGCPSLWGAWQNTYLFIKAYKSGTYNRVYASAIHELQDCMRDLELHRATQPVLCGRLRQRQDYLHITYASNVAVPMVGLTVKPLTEPARPLYRALGGTALCQGVENRLIQAGVILTHTQACAEMEVTDNLTRALFSHNNVNWSRQEAVTASRTARAEFDYALRANTAVKRLLDCNATEHDLLKLASGNFLIAGSGVTDLTKQSIEWIHLGGKGESFTIEDLTFSEDMYVTEEVSMRKSMRVAEIGLRPLFLNRPVVEKMTVSEVGLWQITETKTAWANNILDQLVQLRETMENPGFAQVFPIFDRNREWVNDDSLLVRRATEYARSMTKCTLVLVSSDKRLGRRMARTTGLPVARVDPIEVVINNPDVDYNATMSLTYQQVFNTDYSRDDVIVDYPPVYGEVLIDTGSMQAAAGKFLLTYTPGGSVILNHTTLSRTGVDDTGTRYEIQKRFPTPGIRTVRISVHAPNGVDRTTRPKRNLDVQETGFAQRARAGFLRFARSNVKG